MKSMLIGIALSLIAASAWAEPIIVRSGDHEGFSRLVLHLPQRVDWTISGAEKQKKLLINQKYVKWDIDEVFERMSTIRISDISPIPGDQNGLLINLTCSCQVEVYWHGESMLVFDVKDSGPQINISPNKYIPLKIENPYAVFQASPLSKRHHPQVQHAFQKIALHILSKDLNNNFAENQAVNRLHKIDINSQREPIVKQFFHAERLDLINLKKPNLIKFPYGSKAKNDINKNFQNKEGNTYDLNDPWKNISLSLSVRKISPNQSSTDNQYGDNKVYCIANETLSIENWGNTESFTNQLTSLRKRIAKNYENGDGLEKLEAAKMYLYFGLGAEAKQLLKEIRIDEGLRKIYVSISEIMDEAAISSDVFDDQFHCDSNVALWSILGGKKGSFKSSPNHDAALRALVRLPVHLKKQLGPKLIKNLLEMGQIAASDRFQQTLRGTIDSEKKRSPDSKFTIETSQENNDSPDSITIENNEKFLSALSQVVDRHLNDGMEIPSDWVDLLGSYAHEQRNNDVGEHIKHLYVRSLAAAGLYDSAFSEFSKLDPENPGNYITRTADLLGLYTVRLANDIIFLKHLSQLGRYKNFDISDSVENEVAKRLLGLGFSSEALEYVSEKAERAHQDARRLIREEAALALSTQINNISTVDDLRGLPSSILSNETTYNARQDGNAASKHSGPDGGSSSSGNSPVDQYQKNTLIESTLVSKSILAPSMGSSDPKMGSISLEQGESLIAESQSIRNSLIGTLKADEDFE